MKTVIIYRKDGTVRVMKIAPSANAQHLGMDLDGDNFLRQETL